MDLAGYTVYQVRFAACAMDLSRCTVYQDKPIAQAANLA
jgi:hypothetical protein